MTADLANLRKNAHDGLLQDVLPFWLKHSLDHVNGGYWSHLDRDGQVYDTDKSIWIQGRFAWLLATVHCELRKNDAYLRAAELGIRFLRQHAADSDGKLFFTTTEAGVPLRRRRYYYSEAFAAQAFAAWHRATGDQTAADDALRLMIQFLRENCPNDPPPKFTDTRRTRSLAKPMIALGTAQTLRDCLPNADLTQTIDDAIHDIQSFFVKPDQRAVLETVGVNGECLNHCEGRLLNPGHAMEAAWFILREGDFRNAPALVALGVDMLDWSWERGWDATYGGIRYFADLHHKPVTEYWHDMKFWWPQCEALIATLYAWKLTGGDRQLQRHLQLQQWTSRHFPDPEHGEWFGYLHRDGRHSSDLKGNLWKGPYHLPRMQLICSQLLSPASASIRQPQESHHENSSVLAH